MAESIELVTVKVEEDGATHVVSNGFVDATASPTTVESAGDSGAISVNESSVNSISVNESSANSNNESSDDLDSSKSLSIATDTLLSLQSSLDLSSAKENSITDLNVVTDLSHKEKYGSRMMFECKLCNYTTRRSFNFKRHTVLNHSTDKSQVERYGCTQCSRKFYNRDHLTNHMKKHDVEAAEFQCVTCGRRLNTLKQLANHRKQHSRQLPTCRICCERFMTDDALMEHQIRMHPLPQVNAYAEVADTVAIDGATVIVPSMPQEGQEHIQVITNASETIEIDTSKLQPATPVQAAMVEMEAAGIENSPIPVSLGFTCDICHVITNTQQELVTHKLLHMAGDSNTCPICSKVFSSVTNMKYHMATHTGEKRYKCAYCPRKFNWRSQLITHEHIHTGKGLYYCPLCGKPCMTKWLLTRHIEVHARGSDTVQESYERSQLKKKNKGSPDSPSPVAEQDTTSSSMSYSDHDSYCSNPLVIDSGDGDDAERVSPELNKKNPDEPYRCADCGEEYHGKEEMAQHLLTHLIGNKHTCKKCNKEFRKLAMLRRHLNNSPECAKVEGDADNFLEPFQAIPLVAYERLQKQKCVVASLRHTMVSEMFKVGGAEFGLPGFPSGQIVGLTDPSHQLNSPDANAVSFGTVEEGEVPAEVSSPVSEKDESSSSSSSMSLKQVANTPTLQGLLNAPVRLHTPSDQSSVVRQASPPMGNAPPNLPSPPDIASDSVSRQPAPSSVNTLMITPNGMVPLSLIANLHELELGRIQIKSEDGSDDEVDTSKSTQNTTQSTTSPDVVVKATKNRRFVSTPRKRKHVPEEDLEESPVEHSPRPLQIADIESLAPASKIPNVSPITVAPAIAKTPTSASKVVTLGTITTVPTAVTPGDNVQPADVASPQVPNSTPDVSSQQKVDASVQNGLVSAMETQFQQLLIQLRLQHQQQLAQSDLHVAQLQKQMEQIRQQSAAQIHRVHQRITALEGILSKQQLVINRLLTHVQVTLPDSLVPPNNNIEKPTTNGQITASS